MNTIHYSDFSLFFQGLFCCQGLEELNLTYNNIAAINEVTKLSSLSRLSNLLVEGI